MIDTNALRKKVLDLAIRGKLVPQNPNDEPASILLERIREEKQRLIREGKIKKDKVDSVIFRGDDNCHYEKIGNNEPVLLEDLPFEIPESWTWVRLGDIGDWGAGATPNRNISAYYGGNIPWLKTGELNNSFVYDSEEKITEIALKNCSLRYNRIGDILIAMYGATIGKLAIAGVELTTNQACCACTPFSGIYNFYLFEFLKASKDRLIELGKGGAQPNISREKIVNYLFPLPPYDEQIRIVKELQRIMQYIELLEKNKNEYADLVEVLKKAILQSAIQGTLVEQCESDEPASVLLERIRDEKRKQLGKKYVESYIYKGDDNRYYEHIDDNDVDITEEIPYDLPKNWCWSRIQDISDSYIGLTYKPTDIVQNDGWIVLRSSNIQDGKLDLNDIVRVNVPISEKLTVKKNDIIICARNGSKKLVGKSAIVDIDLPNLTFGAFMAICKTPLYAYVAKFLLSSLFFDQLRNVCGTTTINQLTQNNFNKFLIPIPPLAEQERIVNKINEIFAHL